MAGPFVKFVIAKKSFTLCSRVLEGKKRKESERKEKKRKERKRNNFFYLCSRE